MAEPTSWLLVESGWAVRDADGGELGVVTEVQGAPDEDIFHGLIVDGGALDGTRYVPADAVARIEQGAVVLSLSAASARTLPPPSSS